MTSGQELQEIQFNEIEALQAIYMDDFVDCTQPGAWSNRPIPAFKITLRSSGKDAIEITIKVEFTVTYPKSPPIIGVEKTRGLTFKQTDTIRQLISKTTQELQGQETIFEVTSAVQYQIDDYQRIREDANSLEDERLHRLKIEEEQKHQVEEQQRRLELQEQEEEEKLLAKMVQDELSRRRQRDIVEDDVQVPVPTTSSSDVVVFDRVISIRHSNGTSRFRAVTGKIPVSVNFFGQSYIVKPFYGDQPSEDLNLHFLLCEIDLTEIYWTSNNGEKLASIEQELDAIRDRLRHPNVVALYEWKIDKFDKGYKMRLLMEYSSVGSISDLLDAIDHTSLKVSRNWGIQILDALDAIHKAGFAHGHLTLDNIWLFKNNEIGETLIKIANTAFGHRLVELNAAHPFTSSTVSIELLPNGWLPSDHSMGQPVKKSDIWYFGVLFAQMISGKSIVNEFETPSDYYRADDLPDVLRDFFSRIFKENPKKRPAALDLLTSKLLRTDAVTFLTENELAKNSNRDGSESSSDRRLLQEEPETQTRRDRSSSRVAEKLPDQKYSRYMHDFDEGVVLGRGGFGEVVKVRNKLDGRPYAIKKVRSDPNRLSDILNEVWMLSRLNHQYVVRYFTAWVEDYYEGEEAESSDMPDSTGSFTDTESHVRTPTPTDSNTRSLNIRLNDLSMDYVSNSINRYPEIEFGFSSDFSDQSESESEEIDVPKTLQRGIIRVKEITTLFIQMEYCEKHTLADLIKDGLCEKPDEYWRLLRQIVEALAYMHKEGVIHRDLKPVNIFIDEAQNVKVGDFGLAKNVGGYTGTSRGTADEEDMTGDVGTTLYVAVEMTKPGHVQYDYQADMYSLGIIFFEMVYPMNTNMERVSIIKELRKDPDLFPEFDKEKEKQIIKSLLNHSPTKRPKAEDLLQSGLIPLQEKDERVKEVLKTLVDDESPLFYQVCHALFERRLPAAQEILYDRTISSLTFPSQKVYSATRALMQKGLLDAIEETMRIHAAVPNQERSFLFPRSVFYHNENFVELIDPAGNILQLPYDLTLPFAQRLAQRLPAFPKSYYIGNVYRVNDKRNKGSHPGVFTEFAYDVVSTESGDLLLSEAEALNVLSSIAALFPCYKQSGLVIYLNHSDILHEILDHCSFSIAQRSAAVLLLGPTGQSPSSITVRNTLLAAHNISPQVLDELEKFGFRDDLDKAEQKLYKLAPVLRSSRRFKDAISHIKGVAGLLERLGARHRVCLAPLSNHNAPFYKRNMMFQLVSEDVARTGQLRASILATGGRYDNLIGNFRHRSLDGTGTAHSVGFTLSISIVTDHLVSFWETKNRSKKKVNAPKLLKPRCDVLVGSFSATQIKSTGIDVIRTLQSNGISADLDVHSLSTERLMAAAVADGANWLVLIKQANSYQTPRSFKPFRVRNISQKSDVDLSMEELVGHLMKEIKEDRTSTTVETTETAPAAPDVPSSSGKINIMMEKLKGGHKNSWMFEEACRDGVKTYIHSLANCPVYCLDVKDEILNTIITAAPDEPDDWRRRVGGLAPTQRDYLVKVQAAMAKEMARGTEKVLLYSAKTGHTCVYQLQG